MKSIHKFLLVILLWTGFFWWAFALSNLGIIPLEVPAIFIPIGGLGMLFITLGYAYRTGGGSNLRKLLAKSFLAKVDPKMWIFSLVPAVLMLASMICYSLLAGGDPKPEFAVTLSPMLIGIAFLAWLEEIVWRGYALPGLLEDHSAFQASLILGIVWLPFHLPFFLIANYNAWGAAGFLAWAPWYFVYPFFLSWLCIRSGFSVLLVTISHFSINWVITWFKPAHMENVAALGATIPLILVLVFLWNRHATHALTPGD